MRVADWRSSTISCAITSDAGKVGAAFEALKARPLHHPRYGGEFRGAHATRVLANASSRSRTCRFHFFKSLAMTANC